MAEQHLVVVTGARDYPYPRIVQANLNALYVKHGLFTLFHGACRNRRTGEMIGADRYANDWAETVPGLVVHPFEADWDTYDLAAGPIRNRYMVETAASRAHGTRIHGLAFPGPRSKGTWNCIRCMQECGIDPDVWDTRRARQWLTEMRGTA